MNTRPLCKVDGCIKPSRTRSWCSAHYERWRRNGEPGAAGDARRRPIRGCAVDGCTNQAKARGWCYMHWTRWKNHGDPTFRKNDTYGSKRRVADSGYVFLFKPGHPLAMADGYVAEHRLVMWDAGLLILGDPRMYVHHKNEIRHDNRIENLEVKLDADHTREHVAERGYIINQYGTWPLRHT